MTDYSASRDAILEEAAKVADDYVNGLPTKWPWQNNMRTAGENVARYIRALKAADASEGRQPEPSPASTSLAWSADERGDVHEALFGHRGPNEQGGFCANLGPYVQGLVEQLNDANDLLAMMSPDLVEHHRDLQEQTTASPPPSPTPVQGREEALEKAAAQFRFYEREHLYRAKEVAGTVEEATRTVKAETNRMFAEMCERALKSSSLPRGK